MSLLVLHLPAEFALKSIDERMKVEIEMKYYKLIGEIDSRMNRLLEVESSGPSTIIDDATSVNDLVNAILYWASGYYTEEIQQHPLENYVHQKLFVIMIHVSEIPRVPGIKKHSMNWAAKSIAKFDMDRLCICEGIMLAAFLRRPFSDLYGKWGLVALRWLLEIRTLWRDSPLVDETKLSITTYMESIVFPVKLLSHDPAASVHSHVYNKFVKEIMGLVRLTHGNEMNPRHCIHLLDWATKVWDRLFQRDISNEHDEIRTEFSGKMEKIKVKCGEIDAMMQQLHVEEDGPSNQSGD
jgi:hypothetical protein